MIHKKNNKENPKSWYSGPWNSKLEIPIGYANEGIDELDVHERMNEIYLIAKGWSKIKIDNNIIKLEAGDMIVVEPNELHTFIDNSDDYFHFVIILHLKKNDKKNIEEKNND